MKKGMLQYNEIPGFLFMYNKVKYKSEIKIIAIARKMKICKKKLKNLKKETC